MNVSDTKMLLHCGAELVDRNELTRVLTPSPTSSHHPIPHHSLLHRAEQALLADGVSIVRQEHALSHNGKRYFGLLELDFAGTDGARADDGYGFLFGLRNAHDKSFSASTAIGTRVFVCDNLSFSGEVVIARKHTRWIERDLPQCVARVVGKLGTQRIETQKRVNLYRHAEIDDRTAHDFVIRALRCKAITSSKIEQVINEYHKPRHEEFEPRTVWSLFNAFTEVYKSLENPVAVLKRSQALHGLADMVAKANTVDAVSVTQAV